MKLKTKRTIAAVGLLGLVGVGLAVHTGTGTPSAWGIGDIAAICPLGAVEAAIASRTIVPPLLIGLVIVAVLVALAGRAFCAWGCPVPLLRRVFGIKERKADKPTPGRARRGHDSRNWVLGATVLTTAAFGFPVFCLICPVGLSVATFIALCACSSSARRRCRSWCSPSSSWRRSCSCENGATASAPWAPCWASWRG